MALLPVPCKAKTDTPALAFLYKPAIAQNLLAFRKSPVGVILEPVAPYGPL